MHRLDTFPNKELIQSYRNVFSSPEAGKVFAHMMYELGLFEESLEEEDKYLKSYAARLIKILGGGEVSMAAMMSLLNSVKIQKGER